MPQNAIERTRANLGLSPPYSVAKVWQIHPPPTIADHDRKSESTAAYRGQSMRCISRRLRTSMRVAKTQRNDAGHPSFTEYLLEFPYGT